MFHLQFIKKKWTEGSVDEESRRQDVLTNKEIISLEMKMVPEKKFIVINKVQMLLRHACSGPRKQKRLSKPLFCLKECVVNFSIKK